MSMSRLGVRPKPSTVQGAAEHRRSEAVTHCCHIQNSNVRSCREVPCHSRVIATIEPKLAARHDFAVRRHLAVDAVCPCHDRGWPTRGQTPTSGPCP